MSKMKNVMVVGGLLMLAFTGSAFAASNMQSQIDDIKATVPKFAVPMREVGNRFQNMYFAAEAGNWGLAHYMSHYMDKAMNPAKLTKPAAYPDWRSFYDETFKPVNKAIMAQDFKTFKSEYMTAMNNCNACHAGMGYTFIKVRHLSQPADSSLQYVLKSKATDLP
jgi:hypothetical protein